MSDCDYVDIYYQIATPAVAAAAEKTSIFIKRRFSDHVPPIIDCDRDF